MSKGIYPRETSILVYFSYEGKTYRETLTGTDGKPLPPTPKNVAYASKVREQILRAVAGGTFKLTDYFPHSKTHAGKRMITVLKVSRVPEAVEAFLTSKSKEVEFTTMVTYGSVLRRYLSKPFSGCSLDQIDFLMLDTHMANLKPTVSKNSYNQFLSVFNTFFVWAIRAKLTTYNPVQDIKRLIADDPEPDPLMPDEMDLVLRDMREHYHPQIANYFELAFCIGFRPSEGIDLRWDNLDERRELLLINSAKVWGKTKGVKTHKPRTVELDARCMAILRRQKEYTLLKPHGRIFEYPKTGMPYYIPSDLHRHFWAPSLKRCKIRVRDSRQTRHTCATLMLMSGCRDDWAARQLGHSVALFRRTYSKWIPEIDAGRERDKLSRFLGNSEESFTAVSLTNVSA